MIKNNCIIHCAWNNVQNTLATSHYSHALEQIKFFEKLSEYNPKKLIITGTCYEFGLTTGAVSINDQTNQILHMLKQKNLYAVRQIRSLMSAQIGCLGSLYMYGKGQHDKSIYSQLVTAIQNNEVAFNMSKEQIFDYMAIEEVADKLISLVQNKSPRIVHICKGYPTSLRRFVEKIIQEYNSSISLNLGYYQHREQDQWRFGA